MVKRRGISRSTVAKVGSMDILAAIIAICEAVKAVCGLLMSPKGQDLMQEWKDDRQAFQGFINGVADWIKNIVGGLQNASKPRSS